MKFGRKWVVEISNRTDFSTGQVIEDSVNFKSRCEMKDKLSNKLNLLLNDQLWIQLKQERQIYL